MQQLILPTLPDAAEATVEHVYVAVGDQVQRGQAVVLVRTERFAYDIPAAASGTLLALHAAVGERLSPGAALAALQIGEQAPQPATAPAMEGAAQQTAPAPFAARAPQASPPLRATPLARRMAALHAIDLARVPAGRLRLLRSGDVLPLLEASAPPDERAAALSVKARVRPAPAPSAVTAVELDWSTVDRYLARLRRRRTRKHPDRRACLVSAAAGALLRHHLLHAAWSEQGILVRRGIHIRVGDYVVSGAADLSPGGVALAFEAPSSAGKAEHPFTIVEHDAALWSETTLPDGAAAVLSVGHAETRLRVVEHDTIAARPVSVLALVYDARVLDQHTADAFLVEVRSRLERIGSLC